MSEDSKKKIIPKPAARYFGAVKKDEVADIQHIPVDIKKKSKSFKGDVIHVEEKAKYFARSKWSTKGKLTKQKNQKKLNIKLTVDPYAIQRHSSKYID